jgi:subtilisin family serine protease
LKAIGGGNVTHAWSYGGFRAFAGYFNEHELALLWSLPEIALVEYDCIARIPEYERPELFSSSRVEDSVDGLPGWGQYRSDQKTPGYSMSIPFSPLNDGAGVFIWVLDTGILLTHNEFNDGVNPSRAIFGANFISGEDGSDGNGHGTHCAGTIAGTNAGYARKATVGNVKVLSNAGSGSWSGIIDGMQWVVDHAKNVGGWHIMSMSLGGGKTLIVNEALDRAANSGVPSIVAAGNSNANTINYSPASATHAIAVAATAENNALASFSNYGEIVEVAGPGVNIKSSWWSSPSAYNTISGTSMATPSIAGQVALLIKELNKVPTVDEIRGYIQNYATKGAITPYTSPKIIKNNLIGYDKWNAPSP